MEEKNFFEVFDLQVEKKYHDIFSRARVKRIVNVAKKNYIVVYIESDNLIEKKDIYFMESEIRNFLDGKTDVKIIEHFNLSEQFNTKNLYKLYKESIFEEIYNYNRIEYSVLKKGEIIVNEDSIEVKTISSPITDELSEDLERVLFKIFNERCSIPTDVSVTTEKKELERIKKASKRMESEVENIVKHNIEAMKAVQEIEKEEQPEKPEKKKKTYEYRKPLYIDYNKDDVLYGRYFEGDALNLDELEGEMNEVIVRGKIFDITKQPIRGERTIFTMSITDYRDSIYVKMFVADENLPEIESKISVGGIIKVQGKLMFDSFDRDIVITSVRGILKIPDFKEKRMDNAEKKRVELHCHTMLSDMDGVADVKSLIKRAKDWGHTSLAITDHGVVQGFTEAWHALQKLENKFKFDEKFDFKMLYGVEAYLVDDIKNIVTNSKGQSLKGDYVVFDIETTGFNSINNKIIEIGAVKVSDGKIKEKYSTFVNPKEPIPFRIEELTHINDSMVISAPTIDIVLPEFLEFCKGCVMVAHNADFDMSFIIHKGEELGINNEYTIVDTVSIARVLLKNLNRYKLDTVAKELNITLESHHRAVDDAGCTAEIFIKFIEMLEKMDINDLDSLNKLNDSTAERIKKMPAHHASIIALNETGKLNLYRLISRSHIDFYSRVPRIPKSVFLENKEGLIIGSGCRLGELFEALEGSKSEEEVARIVSFYDYLEIMPVENNMFLVDSDKSAIRSKEDLIEINKKIVKLGEEFNKMVVATGDVHFIDPEDEIYRKIILYSKKIKGTDRNAPLYFRTTDEMLEEFSYLGSDKAYEVVVENTNKIADMVENMFPVHPSKCPPVIENADNILRNICYETAHNMYGENLPEIVTERLERELNSIISNGYAVMYIIAQKLVWKSNEDGYLVGSRGSVGSSFVATMSGITEVNPLSPHYYCGSCHYYDFESEEVRKYAGGCGCDMPDKLCPNCGEKLIKAGFDIPFETFLGFKGNKEPDIDLNFSGDYQSKAHSYTEVIFGAGQTFRAGTIGTVADKTAEMYVRKYCEENEVPKRKCEIVRVAKGCTGVRRTTGQHPGGIIVLPVGYDINQFTPIQHPANDTKTKIITTHFDYHSIDHNLLKLDILGHDDPTMIRMLEDLTGIDAKAIPLDDEKVMSLFTSTKALGIEPEDIDGCKLGSLGIPEFGTDFVIQMLLDTKPQTFSDLVRISGLSHGTDVWLNNAQMYILNGDATISTAICTRDDIMVYLINKGLESETAFTIMESVRKGKGLKDEWIEIMKSHGVEQWYVDSCKKIKYMFPKAHAAAYVMMAFRIAYFKVYYPLAYYTAYFSIRASAFNYEYMCLGAEKVNMYMDMFKAKKDNGTISKKEEDYLKDLKIVQEMYARGFEFAPIDLYKVAAHKFQIMEDNRIMPSLSSIEGMGDRAADGVVDAVIDGPFLSKDDFRKRSGVNKTVCDIMDEYGMLGDIPESNQISVFDLM
ncbi:DNA polymerase-3 subunit alpha [Lachnospiraceae bacterium RM5]|nr:DNA polymerase-3 subunit alpha [Lachnospiraceae bacterium RM5]